LADQPNEELLDAFVGAFAAFDDLAVSSPGATETPLLVDGLSALGLPQWRPLRALTGRVALEALYRQVPSGLPALFEALLLRWRWAEVEVGVVTLLANPVGVDLSGFAGEVLKDRGVAEVLLPAGYIQFARVGGGGYDPVCFDLARGRSGSDARVVQIDHEEILCHHRLRVVRDLYPSFRGLVADSVAVAARKPGRAV
jgi:hypothetical protein